MRVRTLGDQKGPQRERRHVTATEHALGFRVVPGTRWYYSERRILQGKRVKRPEETAAIFKLPSVTGCEPTVGDEMMADDGLQVCWGFVYTFKVSTLSRHAQVKRGPKALTRRISRISAAYQGLVNQAHPRRRNMQTARK